MVATEGIAERIRLGSSKLLVEEVDVVGPPVSSDIRAAGWAEAAVLRAACQAASEGSRCANVTGPQGGQATAEVDLDGAGWPEAVRLVVSCGDPLDEIVLRSYLLGAAHMALGWVCSEGIAVDQAGDPEDLTIRSFGIIRARDMPPVSLEMDYSGTADPVNGSDAAFAAVAAAVWLAQGLPPRWPTRRGRPNMSSHVPSSSPTPVGPYTPVVRAGDWLVCSGQVALRDGSLIGGGVAEQVSQCVANLATLLEAEGASLEDVVKTTVFLSDIEDYPEMNQAYVAAFGDAPPGPVRLRSGRSAPRCPRGGRGLGPPRTGASLTGLASPAALSEAIAHGPHRGYQVGVLLAQLGSHPPDVDVDGARPSVVLVAPHP